MKFKLVSAKPAERSLAHPIVTDEEFERFAAQETAERARKSLETIEAYSGDAGDETDGL